MSATGLLVYLCGFFAGAYLVFQGARMMGNPEKLWSVLNNFGTLTPAKTMRTAAFFPPALIAAGLLLASNTAILFSGILSIAILLAFTRIIIKTPADNLVFGTPAKNSTNPDAAEQQKNSIVAVNILVMVMAFITYFGDFQMKLWEYIPLGIGVVFVIAIFSYRLTTLKKAHTKPIMVVTLQQGRPLWVFCISPDEHITSNHSRAKPLSYPLACCCAISAPILPTTARGARA